MRHQSPVRAITLDLDDTLWPFAPVAQRIQAALEGWAAEHAPAASVAFDAVDHYDDVGPALDRLSARVPLLALTNGNADLQRTGVARWFVGCVSAGDARRREARHTNLHGGLRAPVAAAGRRAACRR